MARNQSFERLNRYRYEIAAAVFLTVAALGLLAVAALGGENRTNFVGGTATEMPASSN